MSLEILLALVTFAFVSSATPGPNNFMLLASGVNFGFRRTIPHMMGIGGGFALLLLAVGFGLGTLIQAWPPVEIAMRLASAAYLIFLAWKIALSGALKEREGASARPMTFFEAAAFQWVNPKAWALALVAMGAYVSAESPVASILLVTLVFVFVSFPSIAIWIGFGIGLKRFLSDARRLRIFNVTMGLLLLLTIWPLVAS